MPTDAHLQPPETMAKTQSQMSAKSAGAVRDDMRHVVSPLPSDKGSPRGATKHSDENHVAKGHVSGRKAVSAHGITEVAGKFRIEKKLGQGSFGDVYKGVTEKGDEVAIKMEDAKVKFPQLFYEAKLLNTLKGGQGIAHLYHVGTEQGQNIVVMSLLGPCLEDLLQAEKQKTFSVKTVCMLGYQILHRIQFMHERGYLHRDIKPENFTVGRGSRGNKVFIIDFGLSKRYVDAKTKEHIPFREGKDLTGTARYASVNAHKGYEQSRRDDLEAIGYMLMYFLRGSMPWSGIPAKTAEEKYRKIKEMKAGYDMKKLCEGRPDEFVTYLDTVRGYKFEDQPDYDGLRGLFVSVMKKAGAERDWMFDWCTGKEDKLDKEGNTA